MVDTFPGKAGSVLSEGKGIEMIAWFVPGQKTLFLSCGSSGKKKKKKVAKIKPMLLFRSLPHRLF